MKTVNNNTNDQFKCNLTDMQYYVTQENGTEPSFNNEYWDNKKTGIYVDIVSGEVLFSSLDKYDSGTGWPSFTKPINKDNIVEVIDNSLGMKRVEIRSKKANSHLGHVFNDGPEPSGVRYCMNSSSLKFIPADEMDKNGYGGYLKLFIEEPTLKSGDRPYYQFATFTAGCFWGVETILKEINGVIETTVGYTGGKTKFPSYYDVSKGNTGHAEAVMIKFDFKIISYEELLGYFWRLHDPTQLNRQGADIGSQYRSAIFYHNEEQKNIALKSKENFYKSGVFNKETVTEITPFSLFYKAEEYHQDYHDKFGGYMCHILREK